MNFKTISSSSLYYSNPKKGYGKVLHRRILYISHSADYLGASAEATLVAWNISENIFSNHSNKFSAIICHETECKQKQTEDENLECYFSDITKIKTLLTYQVIFPLLTNIFAR